MAGLQVDREAQTTINGLKEAAILQQTAQEEKAAIMIADYNKKTAIEAMAQQSAKLQKDWQGSEQARRFETSPRFSRLPSCTSLLHRSPLSY